MTSVNRFGWLMIVWSLMMPCATANDLFSSKWLRYYPEIVNPGSLRLRVDQVKRFVEIRTKSDSLLLRFMVPNGEKLQEIVVNRVLSKTVVLLCKEGNSSGGASSLEFVGADGTANSLKSELEGGENRVFVSEIGSVSESGRYLVAQCGVYEKRGNAFAVLYRWVVLDLFDEGKIVGHGIDDWVSFIGR